MELETKIAESNDIDEIVNLSTVVQDTLTASGSLQIIGPLEHSMVQSAVSEKRCFVAASNTDRKIVGCAFIKPISDNKSLYAFQDSSAIALVERSPKPWWCLHSVMLEPEVQGRGLGRTLVESVFSHARGLAKEDMDGQGGTILLDCWEGNVKLRRFYEGVGFELVGVVPEDEYFVAVYHRQVENER